MKRLCLSTIALLSLCALPAYAGGPAGISDGPGDQFTQVFESGTSLSNGDTITPGVLTVIITATNRLPVVVNDLTFSLDAGPQKWGLGFVSMAMGDDGLLQVPGNYTTWSFGGSTLKLTPIVSSVVVTDNFGNALVPNFGTSSSFFDQQKGVGSWSLAPGETLTVTAQLQASAAAPEPSSFALLLPVCAFVFYKRRN